jgi:phosphoribosylformylglycinamidine cyclo-ligase
VGGISNITGGGFFENIPRCLPKGLSARIYTDKIAIPGVIQLLMKKGSIPKRDMYNTFNMGVGMVVVVPNEDVYKAICILSKHGEDAYIIGEITESDEGVILC